MDKVDAVLRHAYVCLRCHLTGRYKCTCTCLIASGSTTHATSRQQLAILAVTIQISLQTCLTKTCARHCCTIDLNASAITANFRKAIKQKQLTCSCFTDLLSVPITSKLAIAQTAIQLHSCNTSQPEAFNSVVNTDVKV